MIRVRTWERALCFSSVWIMQDAGHVQRCLLYKPEHLLRVVPVRCAHSQTCKAALPRIPQTPGWHCDAKAGGTYKWSPPLHPQSNPAKASGPPVGHASLSSPSSPPPQDPCSYTGLFNSPQEARSNASWSWSQTPTTPPSKAHPTPQHPTILPTIYLPFKPLYYFSIIHWTKNKLPKGQWLSSMFITGLSVPCMKQRNQYQKGNLYIFSF